MRSPSAYIRPMSADGQPSNVLVRGAHVDPRWGTVGLAPVCAAASRESNARATRSRIRSATSRLLSSGGRRRPARSRIVTRFVSVPKPEPASLYVVGDEQVDALRAELVRRPVQGPRSPPRSRRGRGAGRVRHRGGGGRPRRAGLGWGRARVDRPSRRGILVGTRIGRREVGHGRGHHKGVGCARAPGARAVGAARPGGGGAGHRLAQGRLQLRRRLDADDWARTEGGPRPRRRSGSRWRRGPAPRPRGPRPSGRSSGCR